MLHESSTLGSAGSDVSSSATHGVSWISSACEDTSARLDPGPDSWPGATYWQRGYMLLASGKLTWLRFSIPSSATTVSDFTPVQA